MILAAISIQPERKHYVDFTLPYMDYGRDVLLAKDVIEMDMFFFIKPFR